MYYWSIGKQVGVAPVEHVDLGTEWERRRCRPSDQGNVVESGMNIADLSLDSVRGGEKKLRA